MRQIIRFCPSNEKLWPWLMTPKQALYIQYVQVVVLFDYVLTCFARRSRQIVNFLKQISLCITQDG